VEIESLSYRTFKNATYSFLNYAWPIVFSIFITPLVVHRLGVVEYGVYVFLFTLTGFLSLIDFGFTLSLVKHISEYAALKKTSELTRLLGSANLVYHVIGAVGFGVFFVLGKFFLTFFHIPTAGTSSLWVAFLFAGLAFFFNSTHLTHSIVPYAMQRFDIVTKVTIGQLTFFNLAMLVAVLLGFKLKIIFVLYAISMVGWALAFRISLKKVLPDIHIGFAWDAAEVSKVYKFGILAAITNSTFSALLQLDKFLIPILIGPAQLTYYSLAGNVAQKTAGVTGSLGSIFFPLTSAVFSRGDMKKVGEIYKKAFRNLTLIAAAFSSSIVFFGYQILYFWLGKDFADRSVAVLIILTGTYFLFSLYSPLYNFLLGLGRIKFLTIASVSLASINIALIFLLVPRGGIVGAAWAFLGGVILVPVLFYWTEQKILGLSGMAVFYFTLYGKLIITTIIYYALVKLFLLRLVTSLPTLIVVGPVSVMFYFILYKILGFYEAEDWDLVLSFIKKIPARFGLVK